MCCHETEEFVIHLVCKSEGEKGVCVQGLMQEYLQVGGGGNISEVRKMDMHLYILTSIKQCFAIGTQCNAGQYTQSSLIQVPWDRGF